jgi:hypothetical protein
LAPEAVVTTRRRYTPNLDSRYKDTEDEAKSLFETFHARSHTKRFNTDFSWPRSMKCIGEAKAELYRSNKWKSDLRDFEDYKHIAETFQYVYVVPSLPLQYWDGRETVKVHGKTQRIEEIIGSPLPTHFSNIAPVVGIQIQLNGANGRPQKGDAGLGELTFAHAIWGGARRQDTGRAFLFIYTKQGGVQLLVTGDKLDIISDGIVN